MCSQSAPQPPALIRLTDCIIAAVWSCFEVIDVHQYLNLSVKTLRLSSEVWRKCCLLKKVYCFKMHFGCRPNETFHFTSNPSNGVWKNTLEEKVNSWKAVKNPFMFLLPCVLSSFHDTEIVCNCVYRFQSNKFYWSQCKLGHHKIMSSKCDIKRQNLNLQSWIWHLISLIQ